MTPNPSATPSLFPKVCKWYNVYIFTAGVRDYASPLLQLLDKNKMLNGTYYRDVRNQTSYVSEQKIRINSDTNF